MFYSTIPQQGLDSMSKKRYSMSSKQALNSISPDIMNSMNQNEFTETSIQKMGSMYFDFPKQSSFTKIGNINRAGLANLSHSSQKSIQVSQKIINAATLPVISEQSS